MTNPDSSVTKNLLSLSRGRFSSSSRDPRGCSRVLVTIASLVISIWALTGQARTVNPVLADEAKPPSQSQAGAEQPASQAKEDPPAPQKKDSTGKGLRFVRPVMLLFTMTLMLPSPEAGIRRSKRSLIYSRT